jgi:hypothetical protein
MKITESPRAEQSKRRQSGPNEQAAKDHLSPPFKSGRVCRGQAMSAHSYEGVPDPDVVGLLLKKFTRHQLNTSSFGDCVVIGKGRGVRFQSFRMRIF